MKKPFLLFICLISLAVAAAACTPRDDDAIAATMLQKYLNMRKKGDLAALQKFYTAAYRGDEDDLKDLKTFPGLKKFIAVVMQNSDYVINGTERHSDGRITASVTVTGPDIACLLAKAEEQLPAMNGAPPDEAEFIKTLTTAAVNLLQTEACPVKSTTETYELVKEKNKWKINAITSQRLITVYGD